MHHIHHIGLDKLKIFFHDKPHLSYEPLSPHSLEESPCFPITGTKGKLALLQTVPSRSKEYLLGIHRAPPPKYKDPDTHKLELLRLLALLETKGEGE